MDASLDRDHELQARQSHPAASRVGPLLLSSVIAPRDSDGGGPPDDVGAQLKNLFHHVGEMLHAANADCATSQDEFLRRHIAVRDRDQRTVARPLPDPASRPARHTAGRANGRRFVTCDFLAYVDD